MILGITGSFGSGKGAVVDYLTHQRNFIHYSAGQFITDEVRRRNLPLDRDSMTLVANDLRREHGPSFIIESLYAHAQENGGDVIIESLRAVAEVRKIQELGGTVIGIDANSELRYQRAVKRNSEKDHVSYEKFLAQEKAESNPDDPTKQDIFGALKESDFIIENNGTFEDLHERVDEVLEKIKK